MRKLIQIQKLSKISGKKALILSGGFLLLVFVFILVFRALWAGLKQPIAFNHKIHAENGLECSECHPYYKEHQSSGRPHLETCASCHEEPLGESKEEKKLLEYLKSGKEIEWNRLYRIPEDVFFSHKRHVILGNIECKVCHGDIGKSSKPQSKPLPQTMNKCIKCHEERKVSTDCIACHM